MATLYVGSGKDYTTIQSAINAADPGDSIVISAGDYSSEGGIKIDKALTVQAADGAEVIVDHVELGLNYNDAAVEYMTVQGLTIKPQTFNGGDWQISGVWQNSRAIGAVTVKDCIFDFSTTPDSPVNVGIKMSRSNGGDSIESVTITGCTFNCSEKTANAVTMGDKGAISNINISGNTVTGGCTSSAIHMDLGFQNSDPVAINVDDNEINDVSRRGIMIANVQNDEADITITGNTVDGASVGVEFYNTCTHANSVKIEGNAISNVTTGMNLTSIATEDTGDISVKDNDMIVTGSSEDVFVGYTPAADANEVTVVESATSIIVDASITGNAGDIVAINGKNYIIGTNAFTTIEAAITAAGDDATVLISAGDYDEVINLAAKGNKKNVTIIGETDAEGKSLVNWAGSLSLPKDGYTWNDINIESINFINKTGSGSVISLKECYRWTFDNCSFSSEAHQGGFGWNPIQFPAGANGNNGHTIKDCTLVGGSVSVRVGNDADKGYGLKVVGCTILNTNFNIQAGGDYAVIFEDNDITVEYDEDTFANRNGKDNAFIVTKSDVTNANIVISGGSLSMVGNKVPEGEDKGWAAVGLFKNFSGSVTINDVEVKNETDNPLVSNFTDTADTVTAKIDLTGNTFVDSEGNVITDPVEIADELLNLKIGNMAVDYSNYKDAEGNPSGEKSFFITESGKNTVVYTEDGVCKSIVDGVESEFVISTLYVNKDFTDVNVGENKFMGINAFGSFEAALEAATSLVSTIKLESDVTVGSEIGYYTLPANLNIVADKEVTIDMAGTFFSPMGRKEIVFGENVTVANMGQMIAYESRVTLNGDFNGAHLWTFGFNGNAENGATGLTINATSKVNVSEQLEFRGGDVNINGNISDTAEALGDADQIQLRGTTYGAWGGPSGYATKVNLNNTYVKLAQNTIGGANTKFSDGSSCIVTMNNSIYEIAAEGVFSVASTGLVNANNGSIIYINAGCSASNAGTINLTDSTFESKSAFTNSGTFTVSGESTLNISKVAAGSNDIELSEGAILKDSTIMGDVGVTGNVIFRGKNVLNNIYDFGEYDAYGSGNWAKWTVEAGSQLFLEQTVTDLGNNLYGVGYGDTVVINGNLTDAAAARKAGLTKDDASFYSRTGVRFSSAAGYATSSFTVNNAYVILGTDGSFSNSAKNGGSHNITFNTAVVDASQFFFSDSTATFDLKINDSDVNAAIFMTGDKNSVYSLTNSKVVTTGSGNNRYNGNDGALTITNSEITIKQGSYKNTGTITIDENSKLIVPTLENTGTITVDVSDNWKGVATVIDAADGTADFGKIELADEGLTTRIDEANGDLIVYNVDTDKLYVNSAWSDGVWGKEVADGKYFGINAFASLDSALKAGITYGGAAIEMLDETVATENLQKIVTKMTGASGMDFSITGNSAGNEFIAIEMRNAGESEDFTELATLTIKDANLNSYKIAAYQNSKITIENSTIDFHGDQSGPLYTKGNGEIYVKDSVIDNTVQISAMGAVMEFDNSTLNSGSAAQISSVMTFKNGSTYTLSSAKIYGGSGSLTLDGSTMVRKAARTAQDIANSLVYFVNGAANIPTALAKYAYSVFVGGSQYSTTAHTGTGTMTVTNSTFDISKAYADANYADVEGYENSEGLVGVGIGSTLTISNSIFNTDVLMNEGTITIDATSLLTAGSINNEGTITIDATGYTGDAVKIIDLDQEGRLYNVELKGGEGYVLRYESDGDVVLTQAPETGTLYVNSAWAGSENGDGVGDGLIYGLNAVSTLGEVGNMIATDGSDTTIKFESDITSGSVLFNYGAGDITFTADEKVTISTSTPGRTDWDFVVGDVAPTITIGENVTFDISNNESGIYFYYGANLNVEGAITGGQNWGCAYLFYGDHTVESTGTLSVGRVQVGFATLTVNGDADSDRTAPHIDTNYLLIEGATFTANNAIIDAGAVHDSNNGGQRYGASEFYINNSQLSANSVTLKYADSVFVVTGKSDLAIKALSGEAWVYMDNVTLSDKTDIKGGKIRFAAGDNVLDGAGIDSTYFQVGIGAYMGSDDRVDTENGVTVTVQNNSYISADDVTYGGWIGSGYYDTDAEKAEVMTDGRYTLNINDSVAEFGYLHISNDGILNVTGDADVKNVYAGFDYSFYSGSLLINGTATFDNVDALVLNTNVSCDNGTGTPGHLVIQNGAYYEIDHDGGGANGGTLQISKTGVVDVLSGAELDIKGTVTIAADAKLNVNDAVFNQENGAINNDGTITVTDANLVVETLNNNNIVDLDITGTITAGALNFGENGVININIDEKLTGSAYALIDITGNGALDTAKVNITIGETTDTLANLLGNETVKQIGEDYYLVQSGNDLAIFNTSPETIYVNSAYAGKELYDVVNGNVVGINAFSSFREAVGAAVKLGGATIDLTDEKYVYADALNSDANMLVIDKAGTYTITGGEGLLVNYELEINPEKEDADYIVNWDKANVTMCKLTFRDSVTAAIKDSTMNFKGFLGNGTMSGPSYLSVYRDSTLSVENSTVGLDISRDDGKFDDDAIYHNFGATWTVYGSLTVTGSTIYAGCAWGNDSFVIHTGAAATITDSIAHVVHLNVGYAGDEEKKLNPNRTSDDASLVLDNTKVYNTMYQGDGGLVHSGLLVGSSSNSNTNTVTVKNNSVIDMTVNGSVVGSSSDKGLYVGNSNSSVQIESGSTVIVNTGSNSGSVTVDNASLIVTGTFTNTGVFSADGATLNVGTFAQKSSESAVFNNVDLTVTNFQNGENGEQAYAEIGGKSKLQIENLYGNYALRLSDGTTLLDGTSVGGSVALRSKGDLIVGETADDTIYTSSYDNSGIEWDSSTSITVNGTWNAIGEGLYFNSGNRMIFNGGNPGTDAVTTLTGAGTINAMGTVIFQSGAVVIDEDLTINVGGATHANLRLSYDSNVTIKGTLVKDATEGDHFSSLTDSTVTVTGENAVLSVGHDFNIGYEYHVWEVSETYKSFLNVNDGASFTVDGLLRINSSSELNVDNASVSIGSVQNNGGIITIAGNSTVVIGGEFGGTLKFAESGAALSDDSSISFSGDVAAEGNLSFYWNDLSTADGKYLMVDGDLAINGVEMPSGDEVVFAYAGGVSVVGDITINGSTVVDNTIVIGGVKYDVVNDFDNGISISVSDVQEVIPVSFTVNSITQGESDYSFTFDITADGGNGDYLYNVIAKDAYGNVISGTFADGVFTFADPAKSTPASFTVTVSDTYGASTAVSQTIVKDVNDITAPVWVEEVSDTVTGENGLYNVVDVHFEATDNFAVVGFIVTVNGEEFALLGTEHDYFYSTDVTGTYTYTVTAFDAAGNTVTSEEKSVDLYAGMKYDFSGITQSDDNLYNFTVNADVTNGFGDYTYVITSVKNAAGEDVAFTANGLNFTLGELPPELKDETLTVTVKVTDAKQNEITFEGTATVVDKDAPVITVDPIDEAFTNKDVVVKASIADNFGAENVTFQYKIGNGEWTAYNAETGVVMTANGEITFKATDKAGNVTEEIVNINTIDKDAPVVEITGNADAWTNENVTLTVAVGEDVSTITAIEYQIGEDGEWLAVTDGQIVVEANATVNVKVTDGAGNITEQTIIVDKIDKDAPAVEISGNADVWTNENVTLTVAVGEDVSGTTIEYQIGEDGEWLVSTDGQIVVEANATVNVKVTDGAGNIVTDTIIVDKIDKDDPEVEISGNADVWTNENVTLSVAVAEDPSGTTIEYQIGEDGEWLVSTDGQIVVEANATVNVKVTDGAGNKTTDTIVVDKIDKDDPVVEVSGNADAWTNKNVTLTVAVGEDVSTITAIEYQIGEDGEWLAVTDGQIVVEANATVNVKVTDGAGNDTIQTVVVDKIDKDAPAVEISGNAADWTSENVTLSVAVAEDPSGTTIEYQIGENGEWLVSTDGQIVVESNATVNVKVTDGAGNKTTDTIVVDKIDKAAPDITVEADPSEVTNSDVIVTIAASDDVSGIASTKYSFNGTDWFDYTDAIVVKENTVIYIEVTDNAGKVAEEIVNVSNIDKVAPDAPVASADITELTNETVTVTATFADDVVVKEYSLNGTDWFAYTDGVEMRENGTVYFRGYDAAGNVSSTSEYTVSNIDTTSDNADTVYVFINSGYTAENTVGKSVNGIELVYGENAFASIDDAKNELTDLDSVKFVLVENKTSLSGADDLTGVEAITSVTSTTTVKEGSYKSSINSKGTIAISGADAADTDIHNFKNVSVNMNAVVDSIDGGKATTTETEKSKVAANGTVTVSGSYKFSDAPTGKITIANATVNEVVNYSTINIDMDANVGHVRNESITIADSFKNSTATGKVERSVTLSSTNKAVGTINVAGKSTVVDSVEGFATVNVTDSNVGDIVRSINGAPCGSAKEVLKVTTGKDGVVTATLEESFSASRSGKLTVRSVDNKASVGAVSGYNTVTLDGGNADSIANDALAKRSAKYQQSWENADAYGSFSDYELNFDIAAATLISSLDQYSASGSVTLKNGASAGDIANYSKVTATGSGVIGDITALDVEGIETVAGAIKKQTNVDLKKNTVTETETISSGASVKLDGYTAGSISGYKSVTLKNAAVESVDFGVAGSVKTVTTYDAEGNEVESTVTKSFTRNGSLTATDATVNGNISNYNTVKLIGTAVSGDIVNSTIAKELISTVNGEETIVPTETLSGTVTLSDASVAGTIKDYSAVTFKGGEVESVSNVAKVTVSSGDNTIGSFTGSAEADSFTVAKGATMVLGSADFGNGKDKLTVSGTLILTSAAISNLETITGKGEIAAAADIFADVEALVGTDFKGTLVNLGATAEGFRGTAFELADNVEKKAVAWDAAEAFTGWIGSSEGCTDNVDFITFTADEDGMLSIGGEFDSITLNGNAIDLATVSGGIALEAGMEYTLKLERNSDSISYTLALA